MRAPSPEKTATAPFWSMFRGEWVAYWLAAGAVLPRSCSKVCLALPNKSSDAEMLALSCVLLLLLLLLLEASELL